MAKAPTDIKVKRAEGVLEITWAPDDVARYSIKALREACPCAACIDEFSGRRTLDVTTIPDDIGITDMSLAGQYAVKLTFSDGHDTGIYTWDRLQKLRRKE